eukprot:gene17248-18972_t
MPLKFRYFMLLLILVLLGIWLTIFMEIFSGKTNIDRKEATSIRLLDGSLTENKTQRNCRMHSCFNYFKCKVDTEWKIKVYVYQYIRYRTSDGLDIFPPHSDEFMKIIKSLKESSFLTHDPTEACVFIPNIDILSEKRVLRDYAGKALSSLKYWNNGQNHILFNFFQEKTSSANPLTVNIGQAIIASGSFNMLNFRHNFDISIPIPNTLIDVDHVVGYSGAVSVDKRTWLLTISNGVVLNSLKDAFEQLINGNNEVLNLSFCNGYSVKDSIDTRCSKGSYYNYPSVLKKSDFCLVIPSFGLWKTFLADSLMAGCIPVVFQGYPLPFSSVIDWKRASVIINRNQVENLREFLNSFDANQKNSLRIQALFLWRKYFSSVGQIALTTIQILNDRLSPQVAKTYTDWNGDVSTFENHKLTDGSWPPFFVPLSQEINRGFTVVILTYNRVHMLFKLMERLSKCQSLSKIIIVWNNPNKSLPLRTFWPVINKPWVVVKSESNKLTNRFYPYKEIETEAVLSIDDDISMLTDTEVEFAYNVWRQYPDRLIGFPARYHKQSETSFSKNEIHYHSTWSNDISMVLTGAAFYHNIYNHLFTHKMPLSILHYIDNKMNCEDIAMNFLIANLTRKAPIKVTARKRFICEQCTSNETLWSETSFIKRTECLNVFTGLFGNMPLKTVEFRADPALYKENTPAEVQEFPDIGTV